jgi:ABC-type uncharacterized transport system auxiliary subunit
MKRTQSVICCLTFVALLVACVEYSASAGEQYAFTLKEAVNYALANNPGVVCARA